MQGLSDGYREVKHEVGFGALMKLKLKYKPFVDLSRMKPYIHTSINKDYFPSSVQAHNYTNIACSVIGDLSALQTTGGSYVLHMHVICE